METFESFGKIARLNREVVITEKTRQEPQAATQKEAAA